jgi:hypothetical protein
VFRVFRGLNFPVPDIPASPCATVHPGPDKSGPPAASFLSRHRHQILALVPLAFLLWVIARYAVDVPYRDQWELVPFLDKMYHGQLIFHDLWAQHNEHRILFPRIIMLALARVTGWNTGYELAVNVLLALGAFAVFVHQVKITGRKLGAAGLPWAIPAISLIVFSIGQYQNWLWGWQLQIFLNLLAVMGGIVLLANEPFSWTRFAVAALLGIVALYSFANGALFWPIGLVILLVVTVGARQRIAALTAWALLSGLALASYLFHYQKPAEHPMPGLVFQSPFEYAGYVFKYLGGICAHYIGGTTSADGVLALIFGLGGTMALGWAGWMLVRTRLADIRALLPYFGMSLYSIASALLTGVGRIGFGGDQAIYSRYSTLTVPFWVSLVVLLILLARGEPQSADAGSVPLQLACRPAGLCKTTAQLVLGAAMAMLVVGSGFAVVGAQRWSFGQAYGREALLNLAANHRELVDPVGLSVTLYPKPEVVLERYPFLVQHRLSLFRNWQAPSAPLQ